MSDFNELLHFFSNIMENKKECTVTILVALSAFKKEDDISSNQFLFCWNKIEEFKIFQCLGSSMEVDFQLFSNSSKTAILAPNT